MKEHVQAYGGLSLDERPFDALDSLALTQIVYMPMEGLLDDEADTTTIGGLWDFLHTTYPDSFEDPFQKKRYAFTQACAESARYRDWRVTAYRNHVDAAQETQFCACTFVIPDGSRYISLRGTDLTVAGWKEDLNMSFMVVPAQTEAIEYAEKIAATFDGALMLGGHSKGGNLAVYAAAHVSAATRARLSRIYSIDGPGVDEATLHSDEYAQISGRIESYIPQSSVVGMLLCYHPVYTVVKSSAVGIWQHDALSWQVKDGAFETHDELDLGGRIADEALRVWIDGLTLEDRRSLTDTVFRLISAVDPETIDPLVQNPSGSSLKMLSAFHRLDLKTQLSTRRILNGLFASGAQEAVRLLLPRTMRGIGLLPRIADKLEPKPEPPRENAPTA